MLGLKVSIHEPNIARLRFLYGYQGYSAWVLSSLTLLLDLVLWIVYFVEIRS